MHFNKLSLASVVGAFIVYLHIEYVRILGKYFKKSLTVTVAPPDGRLESHF